MDAMRYATHVEVDLRAIAHNVRQARALAPGASVLVAVKADAYGHGAVAVASHLVDQGLADAFGVATTPEATELRDAGISQPILKFVPCLPGDDLDAAVAAGVSLTVHDEPTISQAAAAAHAAGRALHPIHLKVDTGMRRVGCEPTDARALAALIAATGLDLQGIYTHLPSSDAPTGDEFTAGQLALFAEVTAQIQCDRQDAGLPPVPAIHAANSGGVLGHELGANSMIRPGIMAYGYYPDATHTPRPVELRQAISWRSQVAFVKRIPAGDSVGYGRTWIAPTDRWIATVPVGYADGFSRLNSNRGRMLVAGRSHPVVGRVCMDQTMLDLGAAHPDDPPPARVGDEVVLLGRQGDEQISTDELAELMGTISYEVTCLIGPRVARLHRL